MMLNEQAIDGDVITIHNKTVRTDIAAPAHPAAVISVPDPGVIDARVVAVYRQVSRCSAHPSAPYSGKNIIARDRAFFRGCLCLRALPPRAAQPLSWTLRRTRD